jgi:putative DNA primase/helicase
MPFKDKPSHELMKLEQVKHLPEYTGVLADNVVMVDVDNEHETQILLNIVQSLGLKCKVNKSRKGGHFLFKTDQQMNNRTHVKLAIGITADIKCGSKNGLECLKIDGKEREVLYDTGDYQYLPKYLTPVKSNMDVIGMGNGDGRNNALFSYILPLQKNEFTVDECKECIRIINDFVLDEPLSEDELQSVIRDSAFSKPQFFTSKGHFMFDKFANYLMKSDSIIKLNGKLYIYQDGIYQCGDEYIEAAMIEHIPNLSQSKRKEVLSYLSLLVKQESSIADANLVAFNNGVLDIITGEFNEFSPEYIITNKIPHNYVENAESELLDRTMKKLACQDESVEKLLYQAVGYTFYRRNELRKSFFLLGEKRNGKSTFLDMVQTLLGEANVSNLDLCEIGDRFRTSEISNKCANIGDDINDEWISNTAIFKKVVSGDVITVEKKGKDPTKMRSFCKFFFSANSLPRLGRGKDSSAVMDRLIVIPFEATFSKQDADYDPFIKYKLRSEEVMEALIAKSIPALREVLAENEFITCEKVAESLQEFEKSNNPILEFYDELEESDYVNEPIKKVYQMYTSFCFGNNLSPISALEFQKQMKKQFNLVIRTVQHPSDKKKTRVYEYE